jgi:hypothetical protein
MVGGVGRMGGLPGDGRAVGSLVEAARRAEEFGRLLTRDLRVGEVMRFTDYYYVELEEASGAKATEVLVDPASGAVQLEFGPAMMWNTRYGMMTAGTPDTTAQVDPGRARDLANRWLTARDSGSTADEPETFPGYDTLHVSRAGRVEGCCPCTRRPAASGTTHGMDGCSTCARDHFR